MIKFKVTAIYNTPEVEAKELINYTNTVTVTWDGDSYIFHMDMQTVENDFDSGHQLINVRSWEDSADFEIDGTWQIMLESPELYYAAFHALSIGHDGSHMSYMVVNEPEIIDNTL